MGLSNWGLKVLVHNCPRCPTIVAILRRKFPLERGPKRPQKCTIVDDFVQTAESGLKPPFESPHVDFPDSTPDIMFWVQLAQNFWTPGFRLKTRRPHKRRGPHATNFANRAGVRPQPFTFIQGPEKNPKAKKSHEQHQRIF